MERWTPDQLRGSKGLDQQMYAMRLRRILMENLPRKIFRSFLVLQLTHLTGKLCSRHADCFCSYMRESQNLSKSGIVVIGRNEGDRLIRCLTSLPKGACVVYADSQSSDGSVGRARSLGVETVEVEPPCNAARGRNAGFLRLRELRPNLEFVQFIDGDCEMRSGWMDFAVEWLAAHAGVAGLAGRLSERHPEASIYNHLCELEWRVPPGMVAACGGITMFRTAALMKAGLFRDTLMAGEEPEMCVRLQQLGWSVWAVPQAMATHDAALFTFGQWWKRAVRAGHAFAEVAWLHRHQKVGLWNRQARSTWWWGLLLPAAGLLLAVSFGWEFAILSMLLYVLLAVRILLGRKRQGDSSSEAIRYAGFCMIAKFANVWGQVRFHAHRMVPRLASMLSYEKPIANLRPEMSHEDRVPC